MDLLNIIKMAMQGDVNSQYKLGEEYYFSKDYTESIRWYEMAAKQGDKEAFQVAGNIIKLHMDPEQALLAGTELIYSSEKIFEKYMQYL